jgi:hypothetical protein
MYMRIGTYVRIHAHNTYTCMHTLPAIFVSLACLSMAQATSHLPALSGMLPSPQAHTDVHVEKFESVYLNVHVQFASVDALRTDDEESDALDFLQQGGVHMYICIYIHTQT